mgnify:CR=1 FL=1|jgi:H+/Cl- antiporter ClcA
MKSAQIKSKKERRKSADFWFYLEKILSTISWVLFLFALIMSFYAAPEKNYGAMSYYEIEIRLFWLTPLTGYLYLVIWSSTVGSYASQLINKYRNRRYGDNLPYHLYFLLLINLIWLSVILLHTLSPAATTL